MRHAPVLLLLHDGVDVCVDGDANVCVGITNGVFFGGGSWKLVSLRSSSGGINNAADQRFVNLCSSSSGRCRRCEEDGPRSSLFIIPGGFTASAGDGGTRFVYQLVEMPGWVLYPTFFGGSPTLRGDSSFGVLGCMAFHAASDSSQSGEVMALCHLFLQPGRSAGSKQVGLDLLLKMPSKIFASSSGRRSASSNMLRSTARRTGRNLQGLGCNFIFFRGCCKNLDVTTKKYL